MVKSISKNCFFSTIVTLLILFNGSNEVYGYNSDATTIKLNGKWWMGHDRNYSRQVNVPGLATDPESINDQNLWYKKIVSIPDGRWSYATLTLKGARFDPKVYVNGQLVSSEEGGMTTTSHLFSTDKMHGEKYFTLEIALQSLKSVGLRNASRIPDADRWRTNVSSCIWDDVLLRFHGPQRITRIIPDSDVENEQLTARWTLENISHGEDDLILEFTMFGYEGREITRSHEKVEFQDGNSLYSGKSTINLRGLCEPWSPRSPKLYRLKVCLKHNDYIIDEVSIPYGMRKFHVEGLDFYLNNQPEKLRAGTVVWHRWLRDPESAELAFDISWFEKNVIQRLKEHGANTLRFHLGMPPERFLDLCDKYGLMVQAEWIFFHGMEASRESLVEQWRNWLDLCMRHPSVVLIHPWNETEGPRLDIAWKALKELTPEYPPLVISHRDVIHIHKYWWSLFENLGLYYDSAKEFSKPIMVDEFGGNYLDGKGEPGDYPTVDEAFLRFLGRNHTKKQRIHHQVQANARVAEYWRRIDAAGFSPFTILGSPEDGNHWFLGKLSQGNPKPVWKGLTAAWSPVSTSLEIWDRNFEPGQVVDLPVYTFNDLSQPQTIQVNVDVTSSNVEQTRKARETIHSFLSPNSRDVQTVRFTLPEEGDWQFKASVANPPRFVRRQVTSIWDVRTFTPTVPETVKNCILGVDPYDAELIGALQALDLRCVDQDDPEADIILGSKQTWQRIVEEQSLRDSLFRFVQNGRSLVLLDIGPIHLGQGYLEGDSLGPLQEQPVVRSLDTTSVNLFPGITVEFWEVAEPESHLHPSKQSDDLWWTLDKEATWLWNGLRGGLIVPATDMKVTGMDPQSFLEKWRNRGADTEVILCGDDYYAYVLEGFFTFSGIKNDTSAIQRVREKVRFLTDDAPSLQNRINPDREIKFVNLTRQYQLAKHISSVKLTPLASCGKGLQRNPVVLIEFGNKSGSVILSQLLTRGRLARGFGQEGLYGIRYDPAAVQVLLNMLELSLN